MISYKKLIFKNKKRFISGDGKKFAKNKFAGLPANKKASHVGIILSFVIFVTFLIFLFSIFGSPINFTKSKEPTIDYLKVELENILEANLTTLTISPAASTEQCIEINNVAVKLPNLEVVVKDKDNKIIPSSVSGNILKFAWSEENFFRIYYSTELNSGTSYSSATPCHILQPEEISALRRDFFYTEENIIKFKEDYESNYSQLKKDLNLPLDTDFSFSFTNSEGGKIETIQKETSSNIYSREIPIQYFNKTAVIKSGFINLKVW